MNEEDEFFEEFGCVRKEKLEEIMGFNFAPDMPIIKIKYLCRIMNLNYENVMRYRNNIGKQHTIKAAHKGCACDTCKYI